MDKNTERSFLLARVIPALLALGVTAFGLFGPFLAFPLSQEVSAFQLYYHTPNGNAMTVARPSIALLVIVASMLAVIALLLARRFSALVAGLVAFAGLLYLPLYLAFVDKHWLVMYLEDSMVRLSLVGFLRRNFLPNEGMAPSLVYITEFNDLGDRLVLAWHALGWGWPVSVLGVCGILVLGAIWQFRGRRVMVAAAVLLTTGALGGIYGARAFYAEVLWYSAEKKLGGGDYNHACEGFLKASQLDPVKLYSVAAVDQLAQSYYGQLGADFPVARLFMAEREIRQKTIPGYDKAKRELRQLLRESVEGAPEWSYVTRVARMRLAEMLTREGLINYMAGNTMSARALFAEAGGFYPSYWDISFFQAKVSLDLQEYDACISRINALLPRAYDDVIRADLYSTLGDCYSGAQMLDKAREAYWQSNELDPKANFRAIKALSGS